MEVPMSEGEVAFLAFVVIGMVVFAVTLAVVNHITGRLP
jgi:hypothetical protein